MSLSVQAHSATVTLTLFLLPRSLSLFYSSLENSNYVMFSTVLFYNTFIMFSLGVFRLIHSIGLFTNIALNGTLTLIVDIAPSQL